MKAAFKPRWRWTFSFLLALHACGDTPSGGDAACADGCSDQSSVRDTATADRTPPRDAAPDAAPDIPDVQTVTDAAEEKEPLMDVPPHPDDVPDFDPGVVTLAGSDEAGFVDGLRGDARLNNPVNVAVSPAGDVYVADYGNNAIRKVEPDGWLTTFIRQANFTRPFGLCFAPDGTLYIETDANDRGQHTNTTGTLWRVAPDTRRAELVVRDIGRPRGLAVLGDGRIAMVDYTLHAVRIYDPNDGSMTLLAGAMNRSGFADGSGADARFNRPYGAVLRADGALLVADQLNQRIRVVAADGTVTTLAGTGTRGHTDGPGGMAQFNGPQGIAMDPDGALYVSESDGHYVRRVAPDGAVTTVAGDGTAGYTDGDPLMAQFYGLEGLGISTDGAILYLPDGNRGSEDPYHRVRRILLR